MSARTTPTIEEMAAHIVSEVQYDMRHGKPVSSSCEYAERRLKEMVAAAREEGRAAGYAEAKAAAVEILRADATFCAHHRDQEKKQGRSGGGWTSRIAGVQGCACVIEGLVPAATTKEPK
jgi:hypothetical protein